MFRKLYILITILCICSGGLVYASAAVKRTNIVVPKVVRTLPPASTVKSKKVLKNSLVHTKILDSNLIDPNKISF